jgi:hypothetical protein
VNVTATSAHGPLPTEALLVAGVGPFDHVERNPEPQHIPLNNFRRPLDTVGRKQKHQSPQTNAQS